MDKIRYGITEDVYKKLKTMTHSAMTYEIGRILPDSITMGYGFYGCGKLVMDDEKYYAEIYIGSSCD